MLTQLRSVVLEDAVLKKRFTNGTLSWICRQVCHDQRTELEWASKVCEAYEKSTRETGRGAVTIDGKMIDEVHYKRAMVLQTS